ncbi:MAG: Ig-like domain-containing protein [Edaphobacter sp.]
MSTGASTVAPGGSVKFSVNGSQVATVKLTNGSALLTLANGLPKGTVDITAVYSGDVINYGGSSASLTENVGSLPDTLSLTIGTPAPSYTNPQSANETLGAISGPSITITASVAVTSQIIPGGIVTFYQGTPANSAAIGMASVGTGGIAQIVINTLRAGTTNVVENNSYLTTYNIFAVYSGDTTYGSATSASSPLTIVGPPVCAGSKGCPSETTGATFAITPLNPTITIASSNAGQSSGTATLSVISYGGWSGVLNFTCAGLPKYATCNPYPGTPLVNASTAAGPLANTQVRFTVNTNVAPVVATASSLTWWMGGLCGLLLVFARRRLTGLGLRRSCTLVGLVLLLVGSIAGLNGCSSSAGTSPYVTPSGTSNVTVTMHAAQLDPTSTNGGVLAPDVNVGSFQVTLVVK